MRAKFIRGENPYDSLNIGIFNINRRDFNSEMDYAKWIIANSKELFGIKLEKDLLVNKSKSPIDQERGILDGGAYRKYLSRGFNNIDPPIYVNGERIDNNHDAKVLVSIMKTLDPNYIPPGWYIRKYGKK